MNKKITAIIFSILAAVLYAINIPLSKVLLKYVNPTMMASFLYLGAGIGIGIISLLANRKKQYETFNKKDLPYVLGMIILDIIAPILLMFGILESASANATLLNNFEIVCTSLIALFIFKEAISKRMWIAISLITISSFILSFEDIVTFKFSLGAILVLLATICWGLENNCTRNLSNKNVHHVVFIKGIFSGIGSLIVALCLRESFPYIIYIALSLLLGFVAYGLSIFFYIKAQGIIGASMTSAYYSIAPFVGTFLSFILFKEQLTVSYFIGLIIMVLGTIIVVLETLVKKHTHMHKHTIVHTHNGSTHTRIIEHEHEHSHYITDEHKHFHSIKFK